MIFSSECNNLFRFSTQQGSLYVLLNTRVLYLTTHYWEIIEKIWLAVAQV